MTAGSDEETSLNIHTTRSGSLERRILQGNNTETIAITKAWMGFNAYSVRVLALSIDASATRSGLSCEESTLKSAHKTKRY